MVKNNSILQVCTAVVASLKEVRNMLIYKASTPSPPQYFLTS
jgi:hypothetical protein